MNDVSCCGRLFGVASSERSAGNCCAQLADAPPGSTARAALRSRRRTAPSSRSAMSIGSRSRTSDRDGLRDEDLPAVRDAHHARGAVDRGAVEVVVAPLVRRRRAGRSARAARCPRCRPASASASCSASVGLHARRADRRTPRGCRRRCVLTTRPRCALDALRGDGVVARERVVHALGRLLPQAGAAFDVGEEEDGDGVGSGTRAIGRCSGDRYVSRCEGPPRGAGTRPCASIGAAISGRHGPPCPTGKAPVAHLDRAPAF